MNKIFSHRYNNGEIIVVSELIKKNGKKNNSHFVFFVVSLMFLTLPFEVIGSVVNDKIQYQMYRDFSENKGMFNTEEKNISLINNMNQAVFKLDKAPMPDFSSVDVNLKVSTLISPQYIVSVKHNGSYNNVRFGTSNYSIVDRNNHPSASRDFHNPRLNKLVTDVVPATVTNAGISQGTYRDLSRFPVFYRVGSGTQVYKKDGKYYELMGAYNFSTGSTVPSPVISDWSFVTNTGSGFFESYAIPGDSGSPLFGWDTKQNKWVLVAVFSGYDTIKGKTNWYVVIPEEQIEYNKKEDTDPSITNVAGDIDWTFDTTKGIGLLKQGDQQWNMHGILENNLDKGKNLIFSGDDARIVLKNDVDQGAGALTFNGNYTVSTDDNETWKGGGVIVNSGKTVTWQVNGITNDNLHKLGEGTLNINSTGVNPGGLNVGDGTVILSQKPDDEGHVQAFSRVAIVSGRPTVVLSDAKQVNPDNISWGYRGGVLDINGNSLTFHKLNAFDDGATITSNGDKATLNLSLSSGDNIYHGNIKNNIDVQSTVEKESDAFIIDGGIDINGSFSQYGGSLYFQGHPVPHAFTNAAVANKLKQLGDDSVLTQPVSFEQPDWETRKFGMKSLVLKDTAFYLGRNASLTTNIIADNTSVTLGSKDIYIDKNDSNEKKIKIEPKKGLSIATRNEDKSVFSGSVYLSNKSTLNINDFFSGGVDSTDSSVHILSGNTLFNHLSHFRNSSLNIGGNATLTSTAGFYSDGDVVLGSGSTLSLLSSKDSLLWSSYSAHSWHLNGKDPKLSFGDRTTVYGDIISDYNAYIHFGPEYNTSFTDSLRAAYDGNMSAPVSSVSMKNTFWQLRNNSSIHKLKLDNAQLNFEQHEGFSALDVGKLDISNSQVFMTSDGYSSDKLNVKQSLTGGNNTLIVAPSTTATGKSGSPVSLISAPGGTSTELFSLKTATLNIGFSLITPDVSTVSTEDAIQWVLNGFHVQKDTKAVNAGRSFMKMAYKSYLTEVNNLNKRMGELRDIKGEAGSWARIMSGTGAADGGFSDNYTHVQVGVDKKHELDGLDLFTGFTVTHTDSSASADAFKGKTKSVGAGLYASAMFDSGAYIDLIGKYVHHDNEYTATFAGLGTRDYSTHSWYAGAEAGYRYHVTEDAWIEPQAELVYGAVSGKQFAWKDQGMSLSMKGKDFNPLIGRSGVDVGKSFSGKDWKVTARAGLGYQFDLLANGETVLRDASGEKRIKGEKDSRMLMSVGLNAEIRDNVRFGLEFEKSAFGKYNVDNAVNANFRYSF
ncbi:S6 family peptidase [Escherichia coli]|uniref:S6 family peptidase n=1 Tax=Escherichia coli TaxID=562 RepID=UPI00226F5508|nr:S6 family peptidase [Escherichia coli]MCX9213230.1 autotransporter outer membrane beta-barrel domain-containing protein [Escherichia coli]MCX9275977.1 autotransporter outer membrane beta-barrel domain-containing protein [Escherichia coli]